MQVASSHTSEDKNNNLSSKEIFASIWTWMSTKRINLPTIGEIFKNVKVLLIIIFCMAVAVRIFYFEMKNCTSSSKTLYTKEKCLDRNMSHKLLGNNARHDYVPAFYMALGQGYIQKIPFNLPYLSWGAFDLSSLGDSYFEMSETKIIPPTFRMPGYSWLTSLFFRLGGTTSTIPLIYFQIIFDSLGVLLIFYIIRLLLNSSTYSLLGSIIFALWMPNVSTSSLYFSGSMVPVLWLCGTYLFLLGVIKNSTRYLFISGFVFGLGYYLRLDGLFLFMLLALLLLIVHMKNPLEAAKRVLLFVLPVVLLLSPWIYRNYYYFNVVTLSSETGWVFWEGMDFDTGYFPEYKGYYNDSVIMKLLDEKDYPQLEYMDGDILDGPKAVFYNAELVRKFKNDVLFNRPLDFLLHSIGKIKWVAEGFNRQWRLSSDMHYQDIVENKYLRFVDSNFNLLTVFCPFIFLGLIISSKKNRKLLIVLILPIISLYILLSLTVTRTYFYYHSANAFIPIFIALTIAYIFGKTMSPDRDPGIDKSVLLTSGIIGIIVIMISIMSVENLVSRSPRINANELKIKSMDNVSLDNGALKPMFKYDSNNNILRDANIIFITKPNYPLHTDENDKKQLVDGIVDSKAKQSKLNWVGWGQGAPNVKIELDFKAKVYIGEVVIHLGKNEPDVRAYLPTEVAIYGYDKIEKKYFSEPIYTVVPSIKDDNIPTTFVSLPLMSSHEKILLEIKPDRNPKSHDYIFLDEIHVAGAAYPFDIANHGSVEFSPIRLTTSLPNKCFSPFSPNDANQTINLYFKTEDMSSFEPLECGSMKSLNAGEQIIIKAEFFFHEGFKKSFNDGISDNLENIYNWNLPVIFEGIDIGNK